MEDMVRALAAIGLSSASAPEAQAPPESSVNRLRGTRSFVMALRFRLFPSNGHIYILIFYFLFYFLFRFYFRLYFRFYFRFHFPYQNRSFGVYGKAAML